LATKQHSKQACPAFTGFTGFPSRSSVTVFAPPSEQIVKVTKPLVCARAFCAAIGARPSARDRDNTQIKRKKFMLFFYASKTAMGIGQKEAAPP
jgi:hypothetical protein